MNPFYEQRQEKNETKLRKTGKTWKKKITPMKVTSVKTKTLKPLKTFSKPVEFEPKTNIEDINSSQKQPLEVFCNK